MVCGKTTETAEWYAHGMSNTVLHHARARRSNEQTCSDENEDSQMDQHSRRWPER
jgi:hypothetical protein